MSAFWSGWISGIVIISLAGLVWLLVSVWRTRGGGGGESVEPDAVWDGDLREVGNPAPLWWLALMVALLAYSALYLVLYPGLGNFPGALKWTQHNQLERSQDADAQRYGALRARWRDASIAELAADPQAMRSAAGIYQLHCAGCHGADARGQAQRFPDLTDAAWQWGANEAQITHSITQGRTALMPPWGAVLQDHGVAQVRDYLLALAEGGGGGGGGVGDGGGGVGDGDDDDSSHDNGNAHAEARQLYAQFCTACHGPKARGNPALGAPNLVDTASLYGNDPAAIAHSIANGRTGVMPAWKTRLTQTQIRLLTAWLINDAPTADK